MPGLTLVTFRTLWFWFDRGSPRPDTGSAVISNGPRPRDYLPWGIASAILVFLYWPLLCGHVPAFRDTYHFYYPLWLWLDQQARQGDYFPFYNPHDGTGINLVGESTTALFYPGRLLLLLPWIGLPQRIALYLMAHTAIAAGGAAYAARRTGLSQPAVLLAAVSYGLSCPVFFQHTNPIFLVGAAWLPWALAEAWVLSQTQTGSASNGQHQSGQAMRWPVWVGASSLMLLGGDAQGTVNTGLLTCLALLLNFVRTRQASILVRHAGRFLLAVLAVAGLTAMQWIPTWYWLHHSTSVPPAIAASLTPAALQHDQVPDLLRATITSSSSGAAEFTSPSPRGSRYAYSVAPWHLVTLVWGRIAGNVLPENTRIFSLLSADSLMWIPSLSIGLPTCLLALVAFSQRTLRRSTWYWWCIVLFAGAAMLGNYAPMWLVRNLLILIGQRALTTSLPGDETLGIYWLLSELLPAYGSFRYPAKWSVPFALALCMCAAHGIDQLSENLVSFRRNCLRLLALSATAAVLCLIGTVWGSVSELIPRAATMPSDDWLGRLSLDAAVINVTAALIRGAVIGGVAWLVSRLPTHSASLGLLVLITLELVSSDKLWLVSVPPPTITSRAQPDQTGLDRIWAPIGVANVEADLGPLPASAAERVRMLCEYQRTFRLGKLHLLDPREGAVPGRALGNLSGLTTLPPQALVQARRALASSDHLQSSAPELEAVLAWLGVQQRLVRQPGREPVLALQPVPGAGNFISWGSRPGYTLYVKYLGAARVEFEVLAAKPAEVTMRLYQDGGWQAKLLSDFQRQKLITPQPSHAGLFQTLTVPAGKWRIECSYVPPGLYVGLMVSLLTVCLGFAGWLYKLIPATTYRSTQ